MEYLNFPSSPISLFLWIVSGLPLVIILKYGYSNSFTTTISEGRAKILLLKNTLLQENKAPLENVPLNLKNIYGWKIIFANMN